MMVAQVIEVIIFITCVLMVDSFFLFCVFSGTICTTYLDTGAYLACLAPECDTVMVTGGMPGSLGVTMATLERPGESPGTRQSKTSTRE